MTPIQWTIIYTVNGERYRDRTGSAASLLARLAELHQAGFPAWLETNRIRPEGGRA